MKRLRLSVREMDPELYAQMTSENVESVARKKAERQPRKRQQARETYGRKLESYWQLVREGHNDKRVAVAWRLAATARLVGLGIPARDRMEMILETDEEFWTRRQRQRQRKVTLTLTLILKVQKVHKTALYLDPVRDKGPRTQACLQQHQ